MGRHSTWTGTEEMKLAEMFPEATDDQLVKKFKRKLPAIKYKARAMGLQKVKVEKVPFPKRGEEFDESEDKVLKKMIGQQASPRTLTDEFCRPLPEIFARVREILKHEEYGYLKAIITGIEAFEMPPRVTGKAKEIASAEPEAKPGEIVIQVSKDVKVLLRLNVVTIVETVSRGD